MTLVELLTVIMLLGVVLTAVYSILSTTQLGFNYQSDRATGVDQARLAAQEIEREIYSAMAVTIPSSGSGLSMDVETRTNQTSRTSSQVPTCVQWRVQSGSLQSRWWPSDGSANATGWRTVATNITNTSSTPMFVLNTNPAYANRLIDLSVRANGSGPNLTTGSDVLVNSSVLGRNITYGGSDPCAAGPPG